MKEAEEIIKLDDEKYKNVRRDRLDGEATTALAKLKMKYKQQISEIVERSD
jgi:GDP-D-mannose dehydratase